MLRSLSILSLLVNTFYFWCSAQTAETVKSPISKQTPEISTRVLDAMYRPELSPPYADHGYIVSFLPSTTAQSPNIYVHSGSPGIVRTRSLWFEGATEVRIEDVDASAEGELVVVGTYSSETAGESEEHSFLARFNESGKQTSSDLGAFNGQRVCAAPDRSAWVLGISPANDRIHRGYDLLRRIDPSGAVVGSYLPKNSFTWRKMDFSNRRHPSYLRCGINAANAYLGSFRQFIEVPYKESQPRGYLVDEIGDMEVVGLANLGSGEIYGTLQESGPRPSERGLYLLTLRGDGTGSWRLVKMIPPVARPQADRVWRIIGQDGDKAVYFSEKHIRPIGTVVHVARIKDLVPDSPPDTREK